MNKSTTQIEREIEQTRTEIEGTLAALRAKMSVGEVVEEVSRQFRSSGGPELVRNFGRQVKENPLPLALIGAGLAWLMIGPSLRNGRVHYAHEHELEPYDLDEEYDPDYEYDPYTGTRAGQLPPTGAGPSVGAATAPGSGLHTDGGDYDGGQRSTASGMSESASSATSSVGETASSAASAVRERASSVADTVSHQARRAGSQASWAARRTRTQAVRAGRNVQRGFLDLVEQQPLAVGAIGVALGAALGALLPRTETEDRWVGPARDRLRDGAVQTGREQYEKATHVAEKAYESAKREADAQGLTPQHDKTVAERVEDVARSAADTARSEADRQGLGKV
jgi:hypothetical protein